MPVQQFPPNCASLSASSKRTMASGQGKEDQEIDSPLWTRSAVWQKLGILQKRWVNRRNTHMCNMHEALRNSYKLKYSGNTTYQWKKKHGIDPHAKNF